MPVNLESVSMLSNHIMVHVNSNSATIRYEIEGEKIHGSTYYAIAIRRTRRYKPLTHLTIATQRSWSSIVGSLK